MRAEDIKKLIENYLPGCITKVEGEDGQHFSAVVIAKEFIGKNKVQQQRLVYAALGDHITQGTIHALSIKTYTPQERQEL